MALFRFSVIGSLISGELCHGELKKRIRELAGRRYLIPHSHKTRIAPGIIEDWLYAYRQKSLEGLKPKHRSDSVALRLIESQAGKAIVEYRREHPRRPLRLVMADLVEQKKIPQVFPLSTVYRYLRHHAPKHIRPATGREQKRFSHRFPNGCWQGDVMQVPILKSLVERPARHT